MNGEEAILNTKKAERETLRKDTTDLDALVASNATKAAEKRVEAEALRNEAEKTRAEESLRRAEIAKNVEEANLECQEVEKLRDSITDLTATQEKDADELKLKLDQEESDISAMEAEIASTLDELATIEKQVADHEGHEGAKRNQTLANIADAKKVADVIKNAYDRAQSEAKDFSAHPDEELVLQLKQLDEAEKAILEDANSERVGIIMRKLLLHYSIVFGYHRCSLDYCI